MKDTPKRIKRLLREQAAAAYEEDLRRALLPLAATFDRWREGELTSGELSGLIHEFHNGPARQIWKRYNDQDDSLSVAYAIASGIIEPEKVPPELLDHLADTIRFIEEEAVGE